jgi:lipopolysaccharide/colanic/teichoic acid biosynthesis glycosyltransferase
MSASGVQTEAMVVQAVAPLEQATVTAIACRALDLVLSAALLILLSPLLALIALAVRLDSSGPSLFRQTRYGLGMSTFKINKFRTMHWGTPADTHREYVEGLIRGHADVSADADGGLYKLVVDDRITGVGRVLRRFSLDELPQLWNVLCGEMSLVGPRPAIPYEVEFYPTPEWCERFTVKPGITGLWQVSGRNELNFDQMVHLDLEYAQIRSFRLNLRILVRTAWVVAHGKGAA